MKRRPLDRALYDSVVAAAKRKFAVWPSAYASGWVVKEYKRRGGRYAGEKASDEGIAKWFREEWVDISRPIYNENGKLVGYAPCGRKRSEKGGYPKCRPKKEAMRMSASQVASAVRRKRTAESKAGSRRGRRPINVATYKNPAIVASCGCGWAWQVEEDDPEPYLCHKCWGQHDVLVEM